MTVNDVIKHVVLVLGGIKVPMAEFQTIGLPLAGAIKDLKQCVVFLNQVEEEARREQEEAEKAEQEAAEQAAAEEAPEETEVDVYTREE
jgi:hypothetical protein